MDSLTKVIIVILLLRVGAAFGQPNLLHNGDFEEQFCPTCFVQGLSELEKLKYFKSAYGSPDLFAASAISSLVKPPHAFAGHQYPQRGDNFVGIVTGLSLLGTGRIESEIILYTSSRKLKANKLYRFTIWINLANNAPNSHKFLQLGLEDFNLRDFTGNIATYKNRLNQINDNAHSIPLVNDTMNWVEHTLDFRAKGGEDHFYLFIKFGDENVIPADSVIQIWDPHGVGEECISYYFFDNMSLIELPDQDNPEEEVSLELPNTFTPNADGQNDEWKPRSRNFDHFELQVFNRYGTLVFQSNGEQVHWDGLTLSGEPAAEGVYFIQLSATDRYGELHERQETVHLFR